MAQSVPTYSFIFGPFTHSPHLHFGSFWYQFAIYFGSFKVAVKQPLPSRDFTTPGYNGEISSRCQGFLGPRTLQVPPVTVAPTKPMESQGFSESVRSDDDLGWLTVGSDMVATKNSLQWLDYIGKFVLPSYIYYIKRL